MTDAPEDDPRVAAEIAAMTDAWNKRLLMAGLTMSAIVAFFAVDMWGTPDFAGQMALIVPVFAVLLAAFWIVVRWAVVRQTRVIRDAARR